MNGSLTLSSSKRPKSNTGTKLDDKYSALESKLKELTTKIRQLETLSKKTCASCKPKAFKAIATVEAEPLYIDIFSLPEE